MGILNLNDKELPSGSLKEYWGSVAFYTARFEVGPIIVGCFKTWRDSLRTFVWWDVCLFVWLFLFLAKPRNWRAGSLFLNQNWYSVKSSYMALALTTSLSQVRRNPACLWLLRPLTAAPPTPHHTHILDYSSLNAPSTLHSFLFPKYFPSFSSSTTFLLRASSSFAATLAGTSLAGSTLLCLGCCLCSGMRLQQNESVQDIFPKTTT